MQPFSRDDILGTFDSDEDNPSKKNEKDISKLPVNVSHIIQDDIGQKFPIDDDDYTPGNVKELQLAMRELSGFVPPTMISKFYKRVKKLLKEVIEDADRREDDDDKEIELEEGASKNMKKIDKIDNLTKKLVKLTKTLNEIKRHSKMSSSGLISEADDIPGTRGIDFLELKDVVMPTILKIILAMKNNEIGIAKSLLTRDPDMLPDIFKVVRDHESHFKLSGRLSRMASESISASDVAVLRELVLNLMSGGSYNSESDIIRRGEATHEKDRIDPLRQRPPEDVARLSGHSLGSTKNFYYDWNRLFGITVPDMTIPVVGVHPGKMNFAGSIVDKIYEIFRKNMYRIHKVGDKEYSIFKRNFPEDLKTFSQMHGGDPMGNIGDDYWLLFKGFSQQLLNGSFGIKEDPSRGIVGKKVMNMIKMMEIVERALKRRADAEKITYKSVDELYDNPEIAVDILFDINSRLEEGFDDLLDKEGSGFIRRILEKLTTYKNELKNVVNNIKEV